MKEEDKIVIVEGNTNINNVEDLIMLHHHLQQLLADILDEVVKMMTMMIMLIQTVMLMKQMLNHNQMLKNLVNKYQVNLVNIIEINNNNKQDHEEENHVTAMDKDMVHQ